ncbi:Dyp-type peroxidase family [Filimonas lacunae]|uniref:Dyp-type peroxidase family n=1 Tax=Filimonas lacunae TaxID=477680 RepID=A0A173MKZ6_9BACT|nr:Dyp-type peroxidase [Filimonas lacunae]BAV08325.1 peroxidase [Filimonas lacunae]SIT33366.1 Dyp-type peroxidase family [Filimonas lacunae]
MNTLDTHDIQGIILKGYAQLPASHFLLLAIDSNNQVGPWLQKVAEQVMPGNRKPTTQALNIAFTYTGLQALGLPADAMQTFPLELEDGMTTPHKQLFLGDFDYNDPRKWHWGGPTNEPVHALLMLYALDEDTLDELYQQQVQQLPTGVRLIKKLETSVLSKRKEHFGFRDGIAQPTIEGLSRTDTPENTVAAGEFILGYKNSYQQYPDSPVVTSTPAATHLPEATTNNTHDLGKNGSYLVFRQMEQNVQQFWQYMHDATAENGETNAEEMIKLAAKMMGRWPSGAPICLSPDKDDSSMENHDSFAYRASDSEGLKCPIGSHIRRTNPRDAMDVDLKTSIEISNKHRILRRGRSYGKPVCESLEPSEILSSKNFEGERGLHFLCFNTSIARQFEFIQNAWVNNPKLFNLNNERDPIIGNNHHPEDEHKSGFFSTPRNGLRKRLSNIPPFVTVKGGAYFFMPGIKALSYLSTL